MSDQPTRSISPQEVSAGIQLILRPKDLLQGLRPEYVFDHFPATIGRHPTNDIELPFDAVSRYHARLELLGSKPRLVDLRSSNGTYVNGKRVQIAPVTDQDTIGFGSLEFALSVVESAGVEKFDTDSSTTSSVHFVQHDDNVQTIIHTDLPDDTSKSSIGLEEDIGDAVALRKAKVRLICLYRLQEVLHAAGDEERLLRNVLSLLFDVLPVDRGVMLTRDHEDPSVFRPITIKTKGSVGNESIGISRTILQRCLKERVAILTMDAADDSRFGQAESIVSNRMQSVMCVPLISAHHVFGFCHLDTIESVRMFTKDDLTFLATVAGEVATNMHNKRMLEDKILSERMAAVGQTITGMAHNIKNILLLSQGGVEMMERQLDRKKYDTLDETWGLVRRGLDRVHGLVQEMLDYSRARTIERNRVDINQFITDLCQTYRDECEKRNIACRLELDENCPEIMIDEDGLDKALVNLIVNALEVLPEENGELVLRTAMDEEGNLMISVCDNAGGIPKEVLPRIFVPFFTTKGSKGSGLGLAMTKKFIEDMGGRIEVHSKEDEGTCFIITLYVEPPSPKIEPARVKD